MQTQAQRLSNPSGVRGHVSRTVRSRPLRTRILSATQTAVRTTKKEALKDARSEVRDLIKSRHCSPILVRIAWHDSGTYDKNVDAFPQRGGANGSVRFYPEMDHAANAGLNIAVELLKNIADKHDGVSYADLFQMASAESIELAGGPHIPLRFGRTDAHEQEEQVPEGRLPAGEGPFPEGAKQPGDHLRKVFYRMGLNDQDIVALSGAHTLGRVHKDRSGFGKDSTKYTKDGPGTPGGSSWTIDWLKFDNSYFKDVKRHDDPELVVLATDECLFADEGFRPYAEKYAESQEAFFEDYVKSHLKLSELGVKWNPEPIDIEE